MCLVMSLCGCAMRQVEGEAEAAAAVCRGGGDMDSVEKNEETGNLSTCFQGNRGLETGRLDFVFSTLASGNTLQRNTAATHWPRFVLWCLSCLDHQL